MYFVRNQQKDPFPNFLRLTHFKFTAWAQHPPFLKIKSTRNRNLVNRKENSSNLWWIIFSSNFYPKILNINDAVNISLSAMILKWYPSAAFASSKENSAAVEKSYENVSQFTETIIIHILINLIESLFPYHRHIPFNTYYKLHGLVV